MLEFDSIGFVYSDGHEVFKDLTLKLSAGQRIGIIGDNGCGKIGRAHV